MTELHMNEVKVLIASTALNLKAAFISKFSDIVSSETIVVAEQKVINKC